MATYPSAAGDILIRSPPYMVMLCYHKGHHTLGNIVAGNCCWLQCFLVYDSNVSMLRVSGNCFPRIDISIPGNMFPRTSKGRQICDVTEKSQSAIPFDAYSRGDRGAVTKVRVSWSG